MDKEFEKVFLNKDIFLYSENNNMFVENKITLFFIIPFFLDNLFYCEIIKNLILEATSKLENNRSIQNELDSLSDPPECRRRYRADYKAGKKGGASRYARPVRGHLPC